MPFYGNVRVEETDLSGSSAGGWSSLAGLVPRYLSGICGTVVAVCALVATGAWEDSSPSRMDSHHPGASVSARERVSSLEAGPARSLRAAAPQEDPVVNHYVFYLVGSEEERDSLLEAARGDDFPGRNSHVVIIGSRADEITMGFTQAELTSSGHLAEVIDMRERARLTSDKESGQE